MICFYRLWSPKEGTGLPMAQALREAQDFVRNRPDYPEWRHPYPWVAWLLWGIPE